MNKLTTPNLAYFQVCKEIPKDKFTGTILEVIQFQCFEGGRTFYTIVLRGDKAISSQEDVAYTRYPHPILDEILKELPTTVQYQGKTGNLKLSKISMDTGDSYCCSYEDSDTHEVLLQESSKDPADAALQIWLRLGSNMLEESIEEG